MTTAVYPGSFDPFTLGHLEVLKRACDLFDTVYVGVLVNRNKHCAFTPAERKAMIETVLAAEQIHNARVAAFDGLLADYVRSVGAGCIVRGLRNAQDYFYEAEIAQINRSLAPEAHTVFLAADPALAHISSSTVREIASFGGVIDGLVPEAIKQIIAERLIQR